MTYYASLGAEVTPTRIRREDLAIWINRRRLAGESDDVIRQVIVVGSVGGQLPSGHPCRGLQGEFTCTALDVDLAFPRADQLRAAAAAAAKAAAVARARGPATPLSKKLLMVAGIGIVGLLVLVKPTPRR